MKNKKLLYLISIIIVIIDQIIKITMINKNIIIIPNFFILKYAENKGGAFSILSNNYFIIIVFNIILIILLYKFLKEKLEQLNLKQIISLLMILSGAIGNLIDRVCRGYVIDYIKINLFNFPIFNIADMCIVIGVFFIAIYTIINILKENKNSLIDK